MSVRDTDQIRCKWQMQVVAISFLDLLEFIANLKFVAEVLTVTEIMLCIYMCVCERFVLCRLYLVSPRGTLCVFLRH